MLASLLLGLPLAVPVQDAPRPSHVVFVLIDTCRADKLGMYRDDRETTPFLSSLAEDAVVFERCRSQAPWTKPSMAAMLTSRYPSELGITDLLQRLPDRWTLLPEVLAEAGWHTAGWSTNPLMGRQLSNYAQGFEEFVESFAINRGDPIRFASGAAAKVTERVVPWLETAPADRPTFLYVHVVDPHEEYEPAPEYLELFADPEQHEAYREAWKALQRTRPPLPGLHVTQWNFDEAQVDSTWFSAHGLDLYDADLRACDAALAELYGAVTDAWGDDVLLVLTSDHGEEFMEHGGTSHGFSVYDEQLHVPLMIRWPARFDARRVTADVRSIDIFPTLCEVLGIEAPRGLRGRSLVPLLEGEALPPLPSFSELVEDRGSRTVGEPMGIAHTVVDGRWKLIRNLRTPARRPRPTIELYDLSQDPGEQRNVADDQPEVVARLVDLVERWTAASLGLAAPAVDAADVDPKVLAQLEALGYGGGEGEETGPSDGGRLPLLARAVLEGAERWTLHSFRPGEPVPEGTPSREQAAGYLLRDRGRTTRSSREQLLEGLYRGLVAGVEPPEDAEFRPEFGLRAAYRGHVVDLLLDFEARRVRVHLDGADIADVATARGSRRVFLEVFEARRIEVGER